MITTARGRWLSALAWFGRWLVHCRVWLALWLAGGVLAWLSQATAVIIATGVVGVGLLPGLLGGLWVGLSPGSFEWAAAGPWRRLRWRRLIIGRWVPMCRDARLAERQVTVRRNLAGD